VATIVCE
jgi:hypothetical protein